MPVPKRKRSKQRANTIFNSKKIEFALASFCSQCKEPLLPHRACSSCGFFKGKKVLVTKGDKQAKRTEKRQAHEQLVRDRMALAEQAAPSPEENDQSNQTSNE